MSRKYKDTFRCYLIDHHSPPPPISQFDQVDLAEYELFIDNLNCDSLMFYCKDHWGASYYPTKVPGAFRHEGLDFDLAGRVRSLLAKKDIEFVAYYCIEYDAGAAANFPAWRVVDASGQPVVRQDTYAKWPLCCYQTGYREYCLDQLAEIVMQLQPDALFLDIFGASLCYCDHCQEKFTRQFGYPLAEPAENRADHLQNIQEFLHRNEKEFLEAIRARLKSIDAELAITINFASHYPEEIRKLLDYQFCEPILGDNWFSSAYTWATAQERYPLLMPGEFSQVYNYPSKEKYIVELSEIAAQGCRVGMYSGAQHCDGSLEMEESNRVGAAFAQIKAFWPHIQGSEPLAFAAIIQSEPSLLFQGSDFPQDAILRLKSKSPHLSAILGAMKLCDLANIPWRVYTEEDFLAAPLAKHGMVLLPDIHLLSDALVSQLLDYARSGGTIVATVATSVPGHDQQATAGDSFWHELGLIKAERVTDYKDNGWGGYLRPTGQFDAEGLLQVTHPPVHPLWYKFAVSTSVDCLIDLIPPATPVDAEHWVNWWSPPPSAHASSWPGLVRRSYGSGQTIYAAFDLFKMASNDAFPYLQDLFEGIIRQLGQKPGICLHLDNDLVRTRFARQGNRLIVHQVSQLPKRMNGPAPKVRAGKLVMDVQWLETTLASSRYSCQLLYPTQATLAPGEVNDGKIEIELPDFPIQQILAIEPFKS